MKKLFLKLNIIAFVKLCSVYNYLGIYIGNTESNITIMLTTEFIKSHPELSETIKISAVSKYRLEGSI